MPEPHLVEAQALSAVEAAEALWCLHIPGPTTCMGRPT